MSIILKRKFTPGDGWQYVGEEEAGGGGGSLPDWWTVDSTPGVESVEFAGIAQIAPAQADADILFQVVAPDEFGNESSAGSLLDLVGSSASGSYLWRWKDWGELRLTKDGEDQQEIAMTWGGIAVHRANGSGARIEVGDVTTGDVTLYAGDGAVNICASVTDTFARGLTLLGPLSEPGDGDMGANSVTFWYENTTGAPKLHIKGKDDFDAPFSAVIPLT